MAQTAVYLGSVATKHGRINRAERKKAGLAPGFLDNWDQVPVITG